MQKQSRRFFVFAALLATFLPRLATADDASLAQRLDAAIDQAIAQERIVGAVVLVARNGELVYRRAAGYADREAGVMMRENAIFRLASMTKPIVSAAALALADAGKLGLDDPVTRWIPNFSPRLPDGREPVITVRQLLTHTAGLSYTFLEPEDGPYHRAGISDGLDQSVPGIDENLRRLESVPLMFAPGSRWHYSLATDVLGEIVARAGEGTLPEVVFQRVTGPLRMSDTGFAPIDAARLVRAYADGDARPTRMGDPHAMPFGASKLVYSPARIFNNKIYPSGGAGMVGTAFDYLRFLESLRTGGRPILRAATAEAMTRNAVGDLLVPLGSDGWGFGLGVAVLKDPRPSHARQGAGTWLWGGVYGTNFFVDPAAALTVVMMTNTAVAGSGGPFPDAVRDAIYAGP
jgi:CubicO group peptidase (beta-lactamase class C family)